MALFRWLARKLFGQKKRDISRLEDQDVELVSEEVDLGGGPLKPGNRRRALRDPRLLPKRKPTGLSPLKRKRHFTKERADRLFSRTLRTRNRQIRDLLTDPEQLASLQLPHWESEEEIAAALGITLKQLQHFTIHRHRDKVSHYVTFRVAKRQGGHRLIMAPKQRLKSYQRTILTKLLNKLNPPPYAHAFVRGRSVKTNAVPHVGKKLVVRIDLKDFFPSVTFPRVRGFFLALGYSYPVATTLAMLVTECERQPVCHNGERYLVPVGERHCVQGAPTSPAVCNQIARKMDHRLAGLGRKIGFDYTRYADDLTFSGESEDALKSLLGWTSKIVRDEGFELNFSKTRILRSGGCQKVTGVTVNKVLGMSRKERRLLRARLHRYQSSDQKDPMTKKELDGKLAYLAMLNEEQAQVLRERYPDFR